MKKVLCYFGILVLFSLAIMPPVLRIALPKEKEEEKTETIVSKILSCENKELLIKQSYENDKTKMIIMKKYLLDENETIVSEELIKLFDTIKDNNNLTLKQTDDGEILSIDFSVSGHENLNINNLTQNLEDQKLYYENQQLTCYVQ